MHNSNFMFIPYFKKQIMIYLIPTTRMAAILQQIFLNRNETD